MQYFEIVNAFKIIEIFFELGIPRPPFRPQIGPRVSKFCLPWSGPVPDFQIFLGPYSDPYWFGSVLDFLKFPVLDFSFFSGQKLVLIHWSMGSSWTVQRSFTVILYWIVCSCVMIVQKDHVRAVSESWNPRKQNGNRRR